MKSLILRVLETEGYTRLGEAATVQRCCEGWPEMVVGNGDQIGSWRAFGMALDFHNFQFTEYT